MDGVHIKIVSERVGHTTAGTTLSVYAAFIPNMQTDAAADVDKWLRQALDEQVAGKSVATTDEDATELTRLNDGGPERASPGQSRQCVTQ